MECLLSVCQALWRCLAVIISFGPHDKEKRQPLLTPPVFSNEETEAGREQGTLRKDHTPIVSEPGLELLGSDWLQRYDS